MVTVFIRSIFIYAFLVLMIRVLGKRQLGELEATELVTALLLSEIATLPITDSSIPLTFALVPMITIVSFEVFASFILIKIPGLKRIVSSTPSVIVDRGILKQAELRRQRISIEEFICAIRSAGYSDLSEVYYAIVEENGSITILPKSEHKPLTPYDIDLKKEESGLMHIIISDGKIDANGLKTISKDRLWLDKYLKREQLKTSDVFLMLSDDAKNITLIKKEGKAKKKK